MFLLYMLTTECYSSLTKNVNNKANFYEDPYVKGDFNCTDFSETQNFPLALFGDVFYRILHRLAEKCGKYKRKCTECVNESGDLQHSFFSVSATLLNF
jgi:hypothetical protein